jgi:hypothetical protein
MRQKTGAVSGAIAAIAMIAAQISPAAALTLPSPAGLEKAVTPQVEKVWWCRWGCGGWGWRGPGWGWGAGAVAAGVAAGAVVGAAAASAPYYGGCWRRVVGPYGGVHWARVC